MSPNEWGDFFAGVSAPIAVIWLVIGYFQHGEELRLNTEALLTQQKELKQQVAETALLVEAANQQVQATEQDLQDRQKREAREAEPEFVLGEASSSLKVARIQLHNRGGEVRDVSLHYGGPYEYNFPTRAYIESNGKALLVFRARHDEALVYPIRFTINSTDRLGHNHNQEFEYTVGSLVRL